MQSPKGKDKEGRIRREVADDRDEHLDKELSGSQNSPESDREINKVDHSERSRRPKRSIRESSPSTSPPPLPTDIPTLSEHLEMVSKHTGPEDSILWAWGQKSLGRLGFRSDGDMSDEERPRVRTKSPKLSNSSSSVEIRERPFPSTTPSHEGKHASIWKAHDKPTPVPMPRNVKLIKIAAGSSHSLALADDGSLFSWGAGTSAQLGHYKEVQYTPAKPTLGLGKISSFDAGNSHSVALNGAQLSQFSQLYSELISEDGTVIYQLGRKFIQPQIREKSLKFISVCAGSWHSMALTNTGHVVSWGQNEYGQLGHGRIGQGEHKPMPLALHAQDQSVKFVGIAAGARHSFAISDDGRLYSWGAGEFGQLGHGDLEQRLIPKRIEDPKHVKFIQVDGGTWHSIALSSTGEVYTWGGGGYGQLGNLGSDELEKISYRPTKVLFPPQIQIKKVAAGESFNLALDSTGDIWAWGSNNAGQLGYPTRKKPSGRFKLKPNKVQVPPHVKFFDIAAGASHSLALRAIPSYYLNDLSSLIDDMTFADGTFFGLAIHSFLVLKRCPLLMSSGTTPIEPQLARVLLEYIYTDRIHPGSAITDAQCKKLGEYSKQIGLPDLSDLVGELGVALMENRIDATRNRLHSKLTPISVSLLNIYNTEFKWDFELQVIETDQKIRCHKAILACRLEFFRAAFCSKMQEFRNGVMRIDAPAMPLCFKTLNDLLIYLYTDSHDHIDNDAALQLVANAGYLTLSLGVRHRKLLQFCCDSISSALTIENCLSILLVIVDADSLSDELRSRIVNFIVAKYDCIANTEEFARLPQPMINQVQIAFNLNVLQKLKLYEQNLV